ncbi:hypothetical protein C8J56DRAFT_896603 [Mycena floridula]|nr:hypothetical protein C8J56DRAFT_896603 [Mycena floridula]
MNLMVLAIPLDNGIVDEEWYPRSQQELVEADGLAGHEGTGESQVEGRLCENAEETNVDAARAAENETKEDEIITGVHQEYLKFRVGLWFRIQSDRPDPSAMNILEPQPEEFPMSRESAAMFLDPSLPPQLELQQPEALDIDTVLVYDAVDKEAVEKSLQHRGLRWEWACRIDSDRISQRVRKFCPPPERLVPDLENLFESQPSYIHAVLTFLSSAVPQPPECNSGTRSVTSVADSKNVSENDDAKWGFSGKFLSSPGYGGDIACKDWTSHCTTLSNTREEGALSAISLGYRDDMDVVKSFAKALQYIVVHIVRKAFSEKVTG